MHYALLLAAIIGPAFAPFVSPFVTFRLTDGAVLHMTPLPLSTIAGAIVGKVHFDASGSRAVFVATFPGSALRGDWRHANPSQAYLLDLGHRSLRQLTSDGLATSARWSGDGRVAIDDGRAHALVRAAAPSTRSEPGARVDAYRMAQDSNDADVTPADVDRMSVYRRTDGTYAVTQIGAQILHVAGVAGNGRYAIVGTYAAWIDRDPNGGFSITREGPDENQFPLFIGSAYGDALTQIVPLGHAVYQGAYRNGVAYFAFRHGIRRIVAATRDLLNFDFPTLPKDPAYTLGDGLGAGADGTLYFAGPENGELQLWRNGRYQTRQMAFPPRTSNSRELGAAMARFDSLDPPLRPDQDALDAALTQWRVYPVGDETGNAWVASYLGRVFISDASLHFRPVGVPFPFAVLARTDDGRIWGATPLARTVDGPLLATSASALWSTRDGIRWRLEAQLDGDVGAVGSAHRAIWIAATREWLGRPMLALARLDSYRPRSAVTGASYAGEQIFFAALRDGFYLISGATPAMRFDADQGSLSAFRIDADRLFAADSAGLNPYMRERLDPASDPSLPRPDFLNGFAEVTQPTLDAFARMPRAEHLTLASRFAIDGVDPLRITVMSADAERAYEVKYGERPYPLATLDGTFHGDALTVVRSMAYGPLHAQGTRELWARDARGAWHMQRITEKWSY